MTPNETHRFLRRTITPYVGQIVILSGATMLLFLVALKKQQWELLWAPGLFWTLFASYVSIFAMKYRVYWNETSVGMKASGGPERQIRFSEITEIRFEVAGADECLSQARPSRRIVIIRGRYGPDSFIDVSLRHFRNKDVAELLKTVQNLRPDLALPAVPLNE